MATSAHGAQERIKRTHTTDHWRKKKETNKKTQHSERTKTHTEGESAECDNDRRVSGWLGLGGRRTLRPRRQCHTPPKRASPQRTVGMHARSSQAARQADRDTHTRTHNPEPTGNQLSPLRSETCRSLGETPPCACENPSN